VFEVVRWGQVRGIGEPNRCAGLWQHPWTKQPAVSSAQTKPLMDPTTTSVRRRILRYVCAFAGPAGSDSAYLAEPADLSPCSNRIGAK